MSDLGAVDSLEAFARACDHLRAGRSYSALSRAVRPRSLPPSTLSDLLNARSAPTRETVITFLVACGLDDSAAQGPWLAAWERVTTGHHPRPVGAVRVRQARPRVLGVHAAIQLPGAAGELPPYVPRDLDDALRAALGAASAQGGFVLLLGGSSVGKTRALYEAVSVELSEWWLLHPAGSAAVMAHADAPTPRTVLWLDELQRYLGHSDALPAGVVRRLITAGTVVVATLWPGEFAMRTALPDERRPDPYANDRQLLRLAHAIRVPEEFSPAERRRGEDLAGDDRRIRIALDTADAGFTQLLAAGPALIQHWEQASGRDCYGRAVITAALDARRLGLDRPVTAGFLESAAAGYLSPAQRAVADDGWLTAALAYATAPLHGAASALSPVDSDRMGTVAGYVTADFLFQHAQQVRRTVCPPDSVWRALHACCRDAEELERFGRAAEERMRYAAAEPFYRSLAADDDPDIVVRLADVIGNDGRVDEAIALLAPYADHWQTGKKMRQWLGAVGDVDALRDRVSAGDRAAKSDLVWALVRLGRVDEAVTAARLDFDAIGWHDSSLLADVLAHARDVAALRALADHGNRIAIGRLARVLAEQGHHDEAINLLRPFVDTEPGIAEAVVGLLLRQGRLDDAVAMLRGYADAGRGPAVDQLVDLLIDHGRRDEAIGYLRARATAGDWNARSRVDQYGPVEALRSRADAGDRHAIQLWIDLLLEHDRTDDAIDVLRSRSGEGLWWLPEALVDLLYDCRRVDELRAEVDAGTPRAAERLTTLLAEDTAISMPPPFAWPYRRRSTHRGYIAPEVH